VTEKVGDTSTNSNTQSTTSVRTLSILPPKILVVVIIAAIPVVTTTVVK